MKLTAGSLRWEIRASEIRDRIKSLPSHYKNLIDLHLQKLMISLRSHY